MKSLEQRRGSHLAPKNILVRLRPPHSECVLWKAAGGSRLSALACVAFAAASMPCSSPSEKNCAHHIGLSNPCSLDSICQVEHAHEEHVVEKWLSNIFIQVCAHYK